MTQKNDTKRNCVTHFACDCITAKIIKLEKENAILNKALNAIDDHIRIMQNEKVIDMKEMIRALKVISDNLKEKDCFSEVVRLNLTAQEALEQYEKIMGDE